jgi:S-adenosylmethionine decarboxylase
MAYTDSLFQLGMDLTRSSTAQKEDHGQTALGAHDDRKDYFIERDGVRFAGTHLLIDLFGAKRLDDLKHIKETLKRCVEVAGATLLHIHLHHFTPNGGVSGVAVLAESHISIHSWPEVGYAALDDRGAGDGVQAGQDGGEGTSAREFGKRTHLGDCHRQEDRGPVHQGEEGSVGEPRSLRTVGARGW